MARVYQAGLVRFLRPFFNQPMIWFAICLHLLYGVGLLAGAFSSRGSQGVTFLGGFQHFVMSIGITATGLILTTVAVVAAVGLLAESRIRRGLWFAALMPQYLVLLLALGSSLEAMIGGLTVTNRAGVEVPVMTSLLLITLGPICLAAFWHTVAILRRIALWDEIAYIQGLEARNQFLENMVVQLSQKERQ